MHRAWKKAACLVLRVIFTDEEQKNTPARMELRKYNPHFKRVTFHKEQITSESVAKKAAAIPHKAEKDVRSQRLLKW